MEIGYLIRFGGVIPGKEKAAVDAFTETTKIYGEKLNDGTFTYFEPFMLRTGDLERELGFFIVKGPEERVRAFFESKEERTLRSMVELIVHHLTIEELYVGPTVLEQVSILSEITEKTPALVG